MTRISRRALARRAMAGAAVAAGIASVKPASGRARLDHGPALGIGGGQDPMVTIDRARGTVYVAWIAMPDESGAATAAASETEHDMSAMPTGRVMLVSSTDGGRTFGEPVVASGSDDDVISYVGSSPLVRIGPGGEVYVVYQGNQPHDGVSFGRDLMRVARSTDGGASFGPATDVFARMDGLEAGSFHDAIVGSDGAVHLAWISYRQYMPENGASDDALTEIRTARSDDGGATFGPAVLVDDRSCECCRTSLALGTDGTLYLAWRDQTPQDAGGAPVRNIVLAKSTDRGDTWSTPAAIHDDGWRVAGCPESGPEIVVDSSGRLRAAWFTGKEDGPGVYYAVSEDGGATFSDPITVATDDYFPHANVRIDLDAEDNVWVAWDDRRTAEGAIQLARIGTDGTVTPVLDDAVAGLTADIAVGSTEAVMVWLAEDQVQVTTVPRGGGE